MTITELKPHMKALAEVVVDEFKAQLKQIAMAKPPPAEFESLTRQLREHVYQAVNAKLDELPSAIVQDLLAHCLTDTGLQAEVDFLRKTLKEIQKSN